VAIDATRATLWVVAGDNLVSYGFDGTRQLAIALPHGGGGRALLAVKTTDGSLWLARDETLRSFSAAGQALLVVGLRSDVVGLSIDPGEALLWVATGNAVAAYDAVAGQIVRTLTLGHDADVRDVSADQVGVPDRPAPGPRPVARLRLAAGRRAGAGPRRAVTTMPHSGAGRARIQLVSRARTPTFTAMS
jgi:hypothetical protein